MLSKMQKMTEEQKRLFEDNIKLSFWIINKYNGSPDYDEIQQIAHLAMCEAAIRYDATKGKFSTYATAYMKGYIYKYFKKSLDIKKNELDVNFQEEVDDTDCFRKDSYVNICVDRISEEEFSYENDYLELENKSQYDYLLRVLSNGDEKNKKGIDDLFNKRITRTDREYYRVRALIDCRKEMVKPLCVRD